MTPEITAIVPTHNRTRLLATTLRSVLWQQNVALEVVVVDDGSSDETPALVRGMADPRLRLIRQESARGVCVARNRGVAEARGAWLAFCDDDDLWAPDKLAVQLAAARAAGRLWAYAGAVHVNLELRVMTAKPPPRPERLVRMLPRWNLMPGGSSNVIVRREILATTGGWDSDLINLADWDLWVRLAQKGLPACVDRPLVGYRIHPGNASADTALILREARLIDGRYGAIDYGELYHYLAWVYLRSGRRRAAVAPLIRAAAMGQVRDVTRTLAHLVGQTVARHLPVAGLRPKGLQGAWIAEAETWVAQLRGEMVARHECSDRGGPRSARTLNQPSARVGEFTSWSRRT
jgi:glycosyltransferase involved in cell wall biosynthesis